MRDTAAPAQLRIAAINYPSTNLYNRRMIDHKWKEFLAFLQFSYGLPDIYGETSCPSEDPKN